MVVPFSHARDEDTEPLTQYEIDEPMIKMRAKHFVLCVASMACVELVEARLTRQFRIKCDLSIKADLMEPNQLVLVFKSKKI